MGEAAFGVIVSADAWADLAEIAEYWTDRGESWRGEKYVRDLVRCARVELTDSARANRGRSVRGFESTRAREILAFGVYRIIYEIDAGAKRVDILRFWHAHRDAPPLE